MRGKKFQACFARKFHVIAHPVGIFCCFRNEQRVGFGDPFYVDVSKKTVLCAQKPDGSDKLFHGMIGRYVHGGREKEPLDVIALVKVYGEFTDLFGRRGRAWDVAAVAAHAVSAVKNTVIAQQDFQERYAASVRRERMTAAVRQTVADPARIFSSAAR